MLLPCALLDAPLLRRALWWLMLGPLLPLLLNMLLLGLLLLNTRLPVMLVLPLLLLRALCLLLLLGWLSLLLSMLRVGLGLLVLVRRAAPAVRGQQEQRFQEAKTGRLCW